MPIGLVQVDRYGSIERTNALGARLLGGSAAGESLVELIADVDSVALDLGQLSTPTSRVSLRDVKLRTAAGIIIDLTLARIADSETGEPRILAALIDAGERAALHAELGRVREKLAESERARIRLSSIQAELVDTGSGEPGGAGGPPVMVGSSAALSRVRSQVARVAPGDTTVLIQGETGTGKELVARLIHAESARARQAFVAVNCAALPESLIESELFGHERGAFTGADRRRLGKFELADGGTLFLDEIAELPASAQAKLLRVLQGGTFERVGGSESVKIDARVVAATHRDLARRVDRGLFREDLYYRLNVFRIEVPPLRERPEDLRELVEHLYAETARRLARPVLPIGERSLRRIHAYRWPGNIRELRNAIERATLLADGTELEIEMPESPVGKTDGSDAITTRGGGGGREQTRDVLLDLTLEQLERLQITHALETTNHRVFGAEGAAAKLDINPSTLLSRMDKLGIPRPRTARAGRRAK